MEDKRQISGRQLLFMFFVMRATIAIAFLPIVTVTGPLESAWVAGFVAVVGSVLIALFIGGLAVRFPQQTVVEYAIELTGPILGRLVTLVFLWTFLFIAAVDVRMYGEVLVTAFLPETPLIFIVAMLITASTYAAYKGIEVVARTGDLILPLFVVMIATTILAACPRIEWGRLQPVFAKGLKPILKASITPTFIALQVMALPVLLPRVRDAKKAIPATAWAMALASLLLAPAAVVTVGVLGADMASRSLFPFFSLARAIRITEFLERLEALVVFPWGLGLFVAISVYLYSGAKVASQILGVDDYRPLLPPLAVICIALSLQASADMYEIRRFFLPEVFLPYCLSLILAGNGILWLAYLIRRLVQKGNSP